MKIVQRPEVIQLKLYFTICYIFPSFVVDQDSILIVIGERVTYSEFFCPAGSTPASQIFRYSWRKKLVALPRLSRSTETDQSS